MSGMVEIGHMFFKDRAMDESRLRGVHYVRLAPGTAQSVAAHLNISADDISELVVDVDVWPAGVRPMPLRTRDGWLVAGDPVLLDVNDAGLIFAGQASSGFSGTGATILLRWSEVKSIDVVRRSSEPADTSCSSASL
jgi:hypothetical protein